MVLKFKIKPETELGRCVGIDLVFEDGSELRGSSAVDQKMLPIHPTVPKAEVGQWATVECRVGKWHARKNIKAIIFGYEKHVETGEFRAVVDDIEIRGMTDAEKSALQEETEWNLNRMKPAQVVESWRNAEEYLASGRRIHDSADLAALPFRKDIRETVALSVGSLNEHDNLDSCRPAPLNSLDPKPGVPMSAGLYPELYWGSSCSADGLGSFGPYIRDHPLAIGVSHVVGRNLWASLLAEETCGIEMPAKNFDILYRYCQDMYDNPDNLGSFYRNENGFRRGIVCHDLRECFLALLALSRVRGDQWAQEQAQRALITLEKVTDDEGHLSSKLAQEHGLEDRLKGAGNDATTNGRLIGPLVEYYQLTHDARALRLAGLYANATLRSTFTPDGHFAPAERSSGHIHSITSSLCGITRYALFTGDKEMVKQCIRIMDVGVPEYFSSWGWGDEVMPDHSANEISRGEINQTGDVTRAALLLGDAGHPRFYEMAERFLRSTLMPAQFREDDLKEFMHENESPDGDNQRDVMRRVVGGFSMILPNARSQKGGWPLTTQDIISGAVHALCECYRSRVTFEGNCRKVNLLFDFESDGLSLQSGLPQIGEIRFQTQDSTPLAIRVPTWVDRDSIRVRVDDVPRDVIVSGGYLQIDGLTPGAQGHVTFDVPVRVEKEKVDGTEYTTIWLGSQIAEILPHGEVNPLPF
jgi:hypothetical protein